jgi:subtilisin family serine protease
LELFGIWALLKWQLLCIRIIVMKTTLFLRQLALKSVLLVVLAVFAGFINLPGGRLQAQPLAHIAVDDQPGSPVYVAGEVLVQFKPSASDNDLIDSIKRGALSIRKHLVTPVMRARGHPGITRTATRLSVMEAIRRLENHPAVEFAEPNWVYTHQEVSNDPFYLDGSLWGMYGDLTTPANPFGSQAAEAWNLGYIGSAAVYVGVIDEGIQFTHPELTENVWTNPFDLVDGSDNDGNGYIDDIHGWDFYGNDNSVYDGAGDDHGTHVTGTIAAKGGNGTGVAGVNWNVTYIAAKFLGPSGGTTADAVEAVEYLTNLKTSHGLNIVALNSSWGGGGYSQSLHDAIIRAAKTGILFIAAAGNGDWRGRAINNDRTPYYPACYDTSKGTSTETAASYDAVIAVAAIDSAGAKASWSNYGAKTVDLGAPGVNVLSTIPTDAYAYGSGTSMATPHVTGAAALYAAANPVATAAQIKAKILASVTPTASLSGKTVTGGRLNISKMFLPPPPPPTAPSGLTATAVSKSQINLAWTDNSDNEAGFKIERSTDGSNFSQIATVGANVTAYSNTGLARNKLYYYRVRAYNDGGDSAYSNVASAKTFSK